VLVRALLLLLRDEEAAGSNPATRRQSRRQAPVLNSTELAFDSLSDELRDYGAGQDQRTMPLADRLNSIPGRAAKHSRALGAGGTCQVNGMVAVKLNAR
jgi:hypothetical protein